MTVTTSYGEATVHQVGGTGLPVVLLPGYGSASALTYRPERWSSTLGQADVPRRDDR